MKQMAAARFKERCLSILDTVGDDGLVITKRGKPVAKLIAIRAESASLIGVLRGQAEDQRGASSPPGPADKP